MNPNYKIVKPIGLKEACSVVEKICVDARRFRQAKMSPCNLLIYLDSGNGRKTFARYCNDLMVRNRVLDFSGIDTMITLDFNQDNLSPFDVHDDAAIFKSEFYGIEVHTLSDKFADSCYERNLHNVYVRKTIESARTAMLLIFVPGQPGKSLERLIAGLAKEMSLENVELKTVRPDPYTVPQLAAITEREVKEKGAVVEDPTFIKRIGMLIAAKGIHTAEEASRLGRELVFSCDYSGLVPTIKPEQLSKIASVIKIEEMQEDKMIPAKDNVITPIRRKTNGKG